MTSPKSPFEARQFKSNDGLLISADFYPAAHAKDLILLCHRSHCNRGEYRETAPKLNGLGYACLAIDQRSGMKIFGVTNETSLRARQKGLATGYLDARPDIEAAIDHAYELNRRKPIILFGSSYSASLALWIATQTDKVKAVIVFSPGEYLKKVTLAEEIRMLDKPTFVTGAKKEIAEINRLFRFVNPKVVTLFKPKVEGFHGSKTLWESVEGYETYWEALEMFLSGLKP